MYMVSLLFTTKNPAPLHTGQTAPSGKLLGPEPLYLPIDFLYIGSIKQLLQSVADVILLLYDNLHGVPKPLDDIKLSIASL
jgi:hypothetical protein